MPSFEIQRLNVISIILKYWAAKFTIGDKMRKIMVLAVVGALLASCAVVYASQVGIFGDDGDKPENYGTGGYEVQQNKTSAWEYSSKAFPEPMFDSDAVVTNYEGKVGTSIQFLNLEVQSLRGPILVSSWDKDSYLVEVGLVAKGRTDQVKEIQRAMMNVTFDVKESGDTLNMYVLVKTNEYMVADISEVFGGCFSQIKIHVPRIQFSNLIERDYMETGGLLGVSVGSLALLPYEQEWNMTYNYNIRGTNIRIETETMGIETEHIFFEKADFTTYYYVDPKIVDSAFVDLCVTSDFLINMDRVEADTVKIISGTGTINMKYCSINHLDLECQSQEISILKCEFGDVIIAGDTGEIHGDLIANNVEIETTSGNIRLELVPRLGGVCSIGTDSGQVELKLARGDEYGYDLSLASDSGRISAYVDNSTVEKANGSMHVRTTGFESRGIQFNVNVETVSGDILVNHKGVLPASGEGAAKSADGGIDSLAISAIRVSVNDAGSMVEYAVSEAASIMGELSESMRIL